MKLIEKVFNVKRARSHLFSEYESGDVAYVGNGLTDNAVVGFVKPLTNDRVFKNMGITVSAFCEASVHAPPFIACGRSGNGLVVLEPHVPMSPGQLAYASAYINRALRWRFSWYWQTTADRLKRLSVPDVIPEIPFDVKAALPQLMPIRASSVHADFKSFALGDIYDLMPGDYHNASILKTGKTPLVSCGDLDNGIIGFVTAPESRIYQCRLTVALNGQPLTTKYHPYRFAAKDDIAVCIPRSPLQLTTEMFIQATINRERWRYSYYRKCYVDKLRRLCFQLPSSSGAIDEGAMRKMVEAAPYWKFVDAQTPLQDSVGA
jgi:hypothetical protein